MTKVLASDASAGMESPTKATFRLSAEALMAEKECGCKPDQELQARFEAAQKEAADAKAEAEAAVKAKEDAEAKAAAAAKAAPDADPAPSMSPEDRAELDTLKTTVAEQGKVIEGYQKAEREAVVEVVQDMAPEGFEVDTEAPMEVLMAQRAAFEAAKGAMPKGSPATGRRHGNPSSPELDHDARKAVFKQALGLGEKSKLPAAMQRNRPELLTEVGA